MKTLTLLLLTFCNSCVLFGQGIDALMHSELERLPKSTAIKTEFIEADAFRLPYQVLVSKSSDSVSKYFIMSPENADKLLVSPNMSLLQHPFDSTYFVSNISALRVENDTFLVGLASVIRYSNPNKKFDYCRTKISNTYDCAKYKTEYSFPKKWSIPTCLAKFSGDSISVTMEGILTDIPGLQVYTLTLKGTMVAVNEKILEGIAKKIPAVLYNNQPLTGMYLIDIPLSLNDASLATFIGAPVTNGTMFLGMLHDVFAVVNEDKIAIGLYGIIQPITCDMITKME